MILLIQNNVRFDSVLSLLILLCLYVIICIHNGDVLRFNVFSHYTPKFRNWSFKPHLHTLRNRHGTPNFRHRADDFKARHSQFSTCKRIGAKCNVAQVLLPPRGSLGTRKRGALLKIWRAVSIF